MLEVNKNAPNVYITHVKAIEYAMILDKKVIFVAQRCKFKVKV